MRHSAESVWTSQMTTYAKPSKVTLARDARNYAARARRDAQQTGLRSATRLRLLQLATEYDDRATKIESMTIIETFPTATHAPVRSSSNGTNSAISGRGR